MCDAYFDSGKYRGPETDPDGWHVRAVLGVKKELKRVENRSRTICQSYGHEIEMYTIEQGEKRDKRQ